MTGTSSDRRASYSNEDERDRGILFNYTFRTFTDLDQEEASEFVEMRMAVHETNAVCPLVSSHEAASSY